MIIIFRAGWIATDIVDMIGIAHDAEMEAARRPSQLS
jgi:hypothetical protein